MRDVVQVVEPQSSHGPENTGEQIDGIDGHPWSVEGIEERAKWQRLVQEKKTRKKQKKTRKKPSPIVVPAGIAELCRLANSFPDLPSFLQCGPPTGFINQLPANQWQRTCCLPMTACATESTEAAASKFRKKVNLGRCTYPDGFVDNVFHDSDPSAIEAMLIRSGLTKPDLADFNSRVHSAGNGMRSGELLGAINGWLQHRPSFNLVPAASYVCDFGQDPEGLLIFELSIVTEALRRLAANDAPHAPANETTTPAEVQAPPAGAPAEIEGAKGVPEVPTPEKEGPEKEGPVVSAELGANHQDLTANNRQQSPSHEQPPTANNSNHQPTATSHQQPPASTNQQPPPASHQQPTGTNIQQPPATTSQQLPSTTVSQEPPTTSVQQPTPSELDRAVHCIPSCKVPPTPNMVECASCKNRYHYSCVTFKLAREVKPVRGSAKVMQEVREADPGFEYRCSSCSTAKRIGTTTVAFTLGRLGLLCNKEAANAWSVKSAMPIPVFRTSAHHVR
jgi:hypothetical protein